MDKSKKPKKPKNSDPQNAAFRLLDLPAELQTKIYEFHYADSKPELRSYNSTLKAFKFTGIPNLRLEQTCHKVSMDARRVRDQRMSKELQISPAVDFEKARFTEFCMLDRYSWLRNHIDSLRLFTINPLDAPNWALLVRKCPRLQNVSIEVFPRYIETEYPAEMMDDELIGRFLETALEGEYDDMAIDLMGLMRTDSLIAALGERQEDPHVIFQVHIVKLFVDRVRDHEEPCIELVGVLES